MEDAGTVAAWATPGRERTRAGEEDFRHLYEATSRPLWGYLQHASGRPDVADDLLQETYCRFLLSKTPERDEARVRSYLFRIATNLLHDRYRSRDDTAVEQPAECGAERDEETRLDVEAAMSRLKSFACGCGESYLPISITSFFPTMARLPWKWPSRWLFSTGKTSDGRKNAAS